LHSSAGVLALTLTAVSIKCLHVLHHFFYPLFVARQSGVLLHFAFISYIVTRLIALWMLSMNTLAFFYFQPIENCSSTIIHLHNGVWWLIKQYMFHYSVLHYSGCCNRVNTFSLQIIWLIHSFCPEFHFNVDRKCPIQMNERCNSTWHCAQHRDFDASDEFGRWDLILYDRRATKLAQLCTVAESTPLFLSPRKCLITINAWQGKISGDRQVGNRRSSGHCDTANSTLLPFLSFDVIDSSVRKTSITDSWQIWISI
jgi:hypothetical protein